MVAGERTTGQQATDARALGNALLPDQRRAMASGGAGSIGSSAYAMVPLSILRPRPITAGPTPHRRARSSADLAQHAERLGFHRFWLAEHHGMPGIASAATAVVIAARRRRRRRPSGSARAASCCRITPRS